MQLLTLIMHLQCILLVHFGWQGQLGDRISLVVKNSKRYAFFWFFEMMHIMQPVQPSGAEWMTGATQLGSEISKIGKINGSFNVWIF